MAANLPVASEHAEQAALFRWAAVMAPSRPGLELLFAIPNGMAASSLKEARKIKREGMRPGVVDTCLPVPRGRYHGLFLEMKRSNGVPSDLTANQRWWIERLTAQGYLATWAPGWEKASQIILNYLNGDNA